MRIHRYRRAAVVVAALAAAFSLLVAKPAWAAEMVIAEGVISQFSSGDVGRYKLAAERDSNTLKWRVVLSVWCDNSNGDPVNCDLIEGTETETVLYKQYSDGTVITAQLRDDYLDAANVHIKRFEHPWECEGTVLGKYAAGAGPFRVISRFGEPGGWKNRGTYFTSSFHGSC